MTAPSAAPSWLAALPVESTAALAARGAVRRLKTGEALFRQGDPGDSLALVENGLLRVAALCAAGREIVLDYVGPGGAVGELAVFDGAPRAADVTAAEPSTVRLIPAAAVRAHLRADGAAALAALGQLAARLRRTNALVEALSGSGLEPRLARTLLRHADGGALRMTQGDLAAAAGLSRENVNRQLRDWARRGLVETGRGRLRLLQTKALEAIAEA
ncbi:MAG: Crp/Fnr family transcriptional regulator [Maricaulaceae bacterium]|nr:Crp/Fnr family transcriptional regulator [Maricaulaceae bacterium]